MKLITNNEQLTDLYDQLDKIETISIDTEFVRNTTYFAQLCLIQLKCAGQIYIIDAQSSRINLNLFYVNILSNTKIVKIIHSGRQDLEIFFQLFKNLPNNIFDTQIAAKICGLGSMLSYKNLCNLICQVNIDKTFQYSNWTQRPLSKELFEYATQDVEYLPIIYKYLSSKLSQKTLWRQYQQEAFDNLLNPNIYEINYDNAWKKLKISQTSNTVFKRLKILAAFREEQALILNKPCRHILSDDDLVKIAINISNSNFNLRKLQFKKKLPNIKFENLLTNLCLGLKENL